MRSTASTGVENTVCEYTFYPSLGHCRTSPTWRAFVSRSINLSGDYLSPNTDNSDLYHKCVYGDIRERKFPIEVKQKFRSEVEMSAQFTMIGHTAYNLSKKDAFRINEFINCTEMFLGDKWTHSLLINSGTKSDREKAFVSTAENNHIHDIYDTNEMTKMFGDEDDDEDDEDDDEACDMYRGGCETGHLINNDINIKDDNREHVDEYGFNQIPFQRFMQTKELMTLVRRYKLAEHVHLCLLRMKDALGLEHMTMSDAEYEYEQLLKPVAMLTVRRRMGKTAMRLNLIAKILALFPDAAMRIIYTAHEANLTVDAYGAICSALPEMLSSFNSHRLNSQSLGQKEYFKAEAVYVPDKCTVTVYFLRMSSGDNTPIDTIADPYSKSWLKCRVYKRKNVSNMFIGLM